MVQNVMHKFTFGTCRRRSENKRTDGRVVHVKAANVAPRIDETTPKGAHFPAALSTSQFARADLSGGFPKPHHIFFGTFFDVGQRHTKVTLRSANISEHSSACGVEGRTPRTPASRIHQFPNFMSSRLGAVPKKNRKTSSAPVECSIKLGRHPLGSEDFSLHQSP